jgi:hypothetical protein
MTQKARNGTLTPRQEAAALSLAKGGSRETAAVESGAGVRTVKTWLLLSAFTERIHELRREMTAQALGRLVDNLASAADTLGYLSRKAKSEMVRVIAAAKLFELAAKVHEATVMEERVRALEERQQTPLKVKRG